MSYKKIINALPSASYLQKYKNLLTSITKNVAYFHKVQKRQPPKPTTTLTSMKEWLDDIKLSEDTYDRKVRVNRYLNCMKENSDIVECAICMSSFVEVIFTFVNVEWTSKKLTLFELNFALLKFIKISRPGCMWRGVTIHFSIEIHRPLVTSASRESFKKTVRV